jgi:3-dehydroquinate synthase
MSENKDADFADLNATAFATSGLPATTVLSDAEREPSNEVKTVRIEVSFGRDDDYAIRVGAGLLPSLGKQLLQVKAVANRKKAVVITDTNTGPLYLKTVHEALARVGIATKVIAVAAGEESKSLATMGELWQTLAAEEVAKDSFLVALGGGVVGDLSGFAASTWMRGIPFVQLPTSLLAMVDSAVGGKNGINLQQGKNLVGSFYQPAYVLCDIELLRSLPDAEWSNGLAEIVKSAIIDSPDFYGWVQDNVDLLKSKNRAILAEAIVRALSFKVAVVVADERESGRRECLNYGHTFAHALESAAGFGQVSHGRAVAEGIRFAACLATEAIAAPAQFATEQVQLLEALNLLEALPSTALALSAQTLYEHMLADKKVRDGAVRFVLADAPGKWRVVAADADLINIYLLYWQQNAEALL